MMETRRYWLTGAIVKCTPSCNNRASVFRHKFYLSFCSSWSSEQRPRRRESGRKERERERNQKRTTEIRDQWLILLSSMSLWTVFFYVSGGWVHYFSSCLDGSVFDHVSLDNKRMWLQSANRTGRREAWIVFYFILFFFKQKGQGKIVLLKKVPRVCSLLGFVPTDERILVCPSEGRAISPQQPRIIAYLCVCKLIRMLYSLCVDRSMLVFTCVSIDWYVSTIYLFVAPAFRRQLRECTSSTVMAHIHVNT